jgi:hypothetical protein
LEGNDIPGNDPLMNQGASEASTHVTHFPDGADEGMDPRADPAPDRRGTPDSLIGNFGQGVVRPPRRVPIVTNQVR